MFDKVTCNARLQLATRYGVTRTRTEELCALLEPEDYQLQSMPECSPPKWHLAHTAWFFETFVLAPHAPDVQPFDPRFCYLFNSYYDAVGERWPRPARGLLSRPTVAQVYDYRHVVDQQVLALIESADDRMFAVIAPLIELGLNHEEQHQELLLTDLKHAFGLNPLRPEYASPGGERPAQLTVLEWKRYPSGVRLVGYAGSSFAFDNETPSHQVYVNAFEIASRLVTCGEFLQFMEDGGYDRPQLWLSDGWATRQRHDWVAPLHWRRDEQEWRVFTLTGERPLIPDEPVCHVSYYEADAFARWAGARLPTEFEWETAAGTHALSGNLLDSGRLHPDGTTGYYGDAWVWTASPYVAYPGYRPAAGAIGEYNGKFMCNQIVLRGGSCVTPAGHIRATYRNFFPPEARWQFSGIRLAKDLPG